MNYSSTDSPDSLPDVGSDSAKDPQLYWAKTFASRWSDRELLRFIDLLWDEYFEKVGV